MGQTGIGVMIQMLGGNHETVEAIQASVNKKIKTVSLDTELNQLKFSFDDGSGIMLFDNGQSCCENRYMRTDDNLPDFEGAVLLGFELKEAPNQVDQYGEEHEIEFLDVTTSKGVFTMANHNEHNGYYGGFSIVARSLEPNQQ